MRGVRGRFSLLYPRNRHVPLRVRVFIDYLVSAIAADESNQTNVR